MRVLIVFAHPNRDSFSGAILATIMEELSTQGHETELLDLYAEQFNPVLSSLELQAYETSVSPGVQRYADQIRRSEGIVWIFPTWNYGMPAIMKGYVDRVWTPQIAFRIDQARNVHFDSFDHLRLFIVVTTYGANWFANTFVGNPGRKVIVNCLRRHFPSSVSFAWLALYGMDKPSPIRLDRFLEKVRRTTGTVASR